LRVAVGAGAGAPRHGFYRSLHYDDDVASYTTFFLSA